MSTLIIWYIQRTYHTILNPPSADQQLKTKNETMAKSENPIDTYRKQQRKKEVKKNATARIKARDDKVAATRSVEEVK